MQANTKGNYKSRGSGGGSGGRGGRSNLTNPQRFSGKSKKPFRCWNCHQEGHVRAECSLKSTKEGGMVNQTSTNAAWVARFKAPKKYGAGIAAVEKFTYSQDWP